MPVFSYLAYPVPGAKEALLGDLAALDYCQATPADNQEILILVTDTPDEIREKELQKKTKEIKVILCMASAVTGVLTSFGKAGLLGCPAQQFEST